jgi:hypothetical protein
MPGAVGTDPAQFLDVDVDQLAGAGALITADRLRRLQAGEPAEADPPQHRRDRRGRHAEDLGDLGAGQSTRRRAAIASTAVRVLAAGLARLSRRGPAPL